MGNISASMRGKSVSFPHIFLSFPTLAARLLLISPRKSHFLQIARLTDSLSLRMI